MPLEKEKKKNLTKSTLLRNSPTNPSQTTAEHSYNCHAFVFFNFVHFGVLARKIPLTCTHV